MMLDARYRRYRSQILQVNIRWKALAEIYTMHSFVLKAIFFIAGNFAKKSENVLHNFAEILRSERCKSMQIL